MCVWCARELNTAEINMPVPADEHHPHFREVRALRFIEKYYRAEEKETRAYLCALSPDRQVDDVNIL